LELKDLKKKKIIIPDLNLTKKSLIFFSEAENMHNLCFVKEGGLWYLMQLSRIFQLYRGGQFY
jgi:hypothetical protein